VSKEDTSLIIDKIHEIWLFFSFVSASIERWEINE
jgi:hypothetical protein